MCYNLIMKMFNVRKKLPLTNKGILSLFFIGTGSAFTKEMYQNNLLIIKGEDHLLIDCGSKCFQSLHQVAIGPADIHNLYITHSHADHIGGMEEFLMVKRYVSGKKPNLIVSEEYEKVLWNESLKGGSAYSEIRNDQPLGLSDFVDIQRPKVIDSKFRAMMEANINSINVKMIRTMHIPDNVSSWQESQISYGVIIDNRVFFTSDTRFDKDMLDGVLLRFPIEIIFHDCQLFNGGVHASLDELTTLPLEIKEKIVLMHYGDNWKDFKKKALKQGFHSWAKQHHLYKFT